MSAECFNSLMLTSIIPDDGLNLIVKLLEKVLDNLLDIIDDLILVS